MLGIFGTPRKQFLKLKERFKGKIKPEPGESYAPELVTFLASKVDIALKYYFRLEVEGMENVPDGAALIVGNHNAGITFLETAGLGAKWVLAKGEPLHWLVHDLIIKIPLLKEVLPGMGCVRASHKSAADLLARGQKLVVFPGGDVEAWRPFKKRYQIIFSGRKGFVRLALRQGTPIVPCVFCGGHETLFVLSDGKRIASFFKLNKILRIRVFPLFIGLPWGVGIGPLFHLPLQSEKPPS